ncbi:MAG: radical SAM/SPASM domain-containing protein [Opitutales bacterium]
MIRPALRMLTEPDPRLLWKFCYRFGWQGILSVRRFEKRCRNGNAAEPAFLFISLTDACNLTCQGCWVGLNSGKAKRRLAREDLLKIVGEAHGRGIRFFGILGGEPLTHPDLLDLFAGFPDCYFQLFTNGTLLDAAIARRLRQLGNVTRLISIEGSQQVSDVRRGGQRVFERSMAALKACRAERLIFGVATSVCKSNYDDLVSRRFVNDMAAQGAQYLWYYIYRPVGPRPTPELCLSDDEVHNLRQFLVDTRMDAPLMLVDAYWNHLSEALCPAATGISHHVGPGGDVEPCPPIQFAVDNLLGAREGASPLERSEFLEAFRLSSGQTRGCRAARLSRETARLRRANRSPRYQRARHRARRIGGDATAPGHHQPGREIKERNPLYYFAKKHWFFGFGAYG